MTSPLVTVEIRRHSYRGDNDNLSPRGRDLAQSLRSVIHQDRQFAQCYSSPKKRAIQTAEAFGFTGIKTDERFSAFSSELMDETTREHVRRLGGGMSAYFAVSEARRALNTFAKKVLEGIEEIVALIPPDLPPNIMIVSHGGSIEPVAALALGSEFSLSIIGGPFLECEGIRIVLADSSVKQLEILRLPGRK